MKLFRRKQQEQQQTVGLANFPGGIPGMIPNPQKFIDDLLDDIEKPNMMLKTVDRQGKPLPGSMGSKPNLKGINFEAWGGFEAFLNQTSTGAGGVAKPQMLRRVLPWFAKANSMTSNAIADLPFDIMEGKTVIDSSEKWENKLGGMPSPKKLIKKLASSLCMGKAYIIPTVAEDRNLILDLHYCAPHTVFPMITNHGLQYFTRGSDYGEFGVYYPFDQEEAILSADSYRGPMMYFWLPDSDVEIGPAKTYPAGTALLAAELLTGIDSVLNGYAERGFVPATILSGKGFPNPADRKTAEEWWNRFLHGWTSNAAKIMNADAMTAVKVGAGLDELKTVYADITRQAIENIGASHGIPAALFMSDAAFASEANEMVKTWYNTSEFISIYHCIEDTFNEQLLDRFGYHLTFKPESLAIFSEDASSRATAFRDYVSTRMRPSVAAQLCGIKMPEGIELSKLDEDFDKPEPDKPVNPLNNPGMPPAQEPAPNAPGSAPAPFGKSLNAADIKDLDLWRQLAVRCHKNGKGNAVDFECKSLSDDLAEPIRAKLKAATSESEVIAAFEIISTGNRDDGLKALAASLDKMTMAILQGA